MIVAGGSTPSASMSVGTMSIAWWYCVADLALRLHAGRPGDDARVARAAVELVALPHLERRVERHRPAVRVVVVRLRAAELVEHRHVGLDGVGDAVRELHLVDGAVRAALARGAVVGDQDDDRVLAPAELLEEAEQASDLVVGVREEPGVDLRHSREELLLVIRERVPRPRVVEWRERLAVRPGARLARPDRVDRRQLGVLRDEAELLLPGEGLLAHRLVAHVEAALVLVGPLARNVMRCMAGAGRVVEEERLLGRDRLRVHDELDRLVGEVDRQVVALLRRFRLVDEMVVVDEVGIPLARLGSEEAVPALEASAARPVAPCRGEVHLVVGAQVPFADHVRVPAGLAEDLRQHPVLRWDRPARVREADRGLGDARHAVARVVASREQARASRRTERGRVPLRVANAACRERVDVRRLDRPAVAAERGEADVVEHDVDDARRALRCLRRLERRPVGLRVANVDVDDPVERLAHRRSFRSTVWAAEAETLSD